MSETAGNLPPDEVAARRSIDRGKRAIERILREHLSIPAAMTHPQLGDVTFDWGEQGDPEKDYKGGWGITHILARHGADALSRIPSVIALGAVVRQYGPPVGRRVDVSDGTHTVVLSLHRYAKRETWLLTGWKEKGPGGPGSGSALSGPTPSGPTLNRPEGGAGPINIIGAANPKVNLGARISDKERAGGGPPAQQPPPTLRPNRTRPQAGRLDASAGPASSAGPTHIIGATKSRINPLEGAP